MPRLLALLRSMGIAISKRQLVRLLNENHQGFIAEAQVLRAGLATSPWVSADGTPVRVMPARTGFARRSAMSGSHGSPHVVVEKPAELLLDLLRAGYNWTCSTMRLTTCETKACQRLRSPV